MRSALLRIVLLVRVDDTELGGHISHLVLHLLLQQADGTSSVGPDLIPGAGGSSSVGLDLIPGAGGTSSVGLDLIPGAGGTSS